MNAPPMSDEDEILGLEVQRYTAMIERDLETFSALCHPDLAYAHSDGVRDSLESYLTKCRAGYYVYHHIDHPVERVSIIGDTAIVAGKMHADITAGGTDMRLDNSSLAVWTRTDDGWRLLAYQPTRLLEC